MSDEQVENSEVSEEVAKPEAVTPKPEKKHLFQKACKNCDKLKQELQDCKTGWQRALADYQNLQKETVNRRSEWAQISEQYILEEFIPVYEHLKMSVKGNVSEESNPWLSGVRHVLKQFSDILKSHAVEEITTIGEKFNPELHEAVGHEPFEGAKEDEIVREISGGYTMGGRVIKAARVIVNKI